MRNEAETPALTFLARIGAQDGGWKSGDAYKVSLGGIPIELLRMNDTTVELMQITTPASARRQGLASKAMDELLAAADEAGVTLELSVWGGGGKKALSEKMLREWYRRCGFLPDRQIQVGPFPTTIYQRRPKASRQHRLSEGVSLESTERQAAYIVAVAEAYDAAPAHDPKADRYWEILVRHAQLVLFKRLKGSGIRVTFEPDDPYEVYGGDAMKFMLYDMLMNHRLRIYSGFSDNHPTFTPEENVIFRAVHDFFTHGTVRKTFLNGLKKAAREMKLKAWPKLEDAGPLLARVSLPSHAFTARGEFNATSEHMRLAPQAAAPAIFTEVTGQVCYHNLCHEFPEQKVAILPGFDYRHIGKCVPGSAAEARMNEVYEALQRGDEIIPLHLKALHEISREDLLASARH